MVAEPIDEISRKLISFHFALHHIDSAPLPGGAVRNLLFNARHTVDWGEGEAGGDLLLFAIGSERSAIARGPPPAWKWGC